MLEKFREFQAKMPTGAPDIGIPWVEVPEMPEFPDIDKLRFELELKMDKAVKQIAALKAVASVVGNIRVYFII